MVNYMENGYYGTSLIQEKSNIIFKLFFGKIAITKETKIFRIASWPAQN